MRNRMCAENVKEINQQREEGVKSERVLLSVNGCFHFYFWTVNSLWEARFTEHHQLLKGELVILKLLWLDFISEKAEVSVCKSNEAEVDNIFFRISVNSSVLLQSWLWSVRIAGHLVLIRNKFRLTSELTVVWKEVSASSNLLVSEQLLTWRKWHTDCNISKGCVTSHNVEFQFVCEGH